MLFRGKPLSEVNETDLQELVENSVLEEKTLEYKEAIVRGSDRQKKEFLADVSSFANASGGHVVYGMAADSTTRLPTGLVGLEIGNPDDEINAIESAARDGIAPRIPRLRSHPVSLTNGRWVIVMEIPRSLLAPHRVEFDGHGRFYTRSTAGKYPMDVDELRSAFVGGALRAGRMRALREERLGVVRQGHLPVRIEENPRVVLHVVPFSMLDPGPGVDVLAAAGDMRIHPFTARVQDCQERHNIDGFLRYTLPPPDDRYSEVGRYVQVFEDGMIEAVDTCMMRSIAEHRLPSHLFANEVARAVRDYTAALQDLGVDPPFAVLLSLLGVKDMDIALHNTQRERILKERGLYRRFDRADIVVPELIIDDLSTPVTQQLRPLFDDVWRAAGWPRAEEYYNEEGQWLLGDIEDP